MVKMYQHRFCIYTKVSFIRPFYLYGILAGKHCCSGNGEQYIDLVQIILELAKQLLEEKENSSNNCSMNH